MDANSTLIDTKQKADFLRECFNELRSLTEMIPFLILQDIARFGIYDFMYINKNPPSLAIVDKNLRESQYRSLNDFVDDLQRIFTSVSDYLFSDDPNQSLCQKLMMRTRGFQNRFLEKFLNPRTQTSKRRILVQKKEEEKPKEKPKDVERIASLSQKLEMTFLLRHQANNESYLRSVGSHYGIGKDTNEEYCIHLDNKNSTWHKFIAKQ